MPKHALPIRLLPGMNRMPVPVLHHIRARRKIRINIQPKLSVIRRKLARRIPAECLRIRLSHQKIRPLQRPRKVTLQRLPRPIQMILRPVIRIVGHHIQRLRNLQFVDIHLHHGAIVLRHKLIRPPTLPHQRSLERKIVRHPHLLPSRPLQLVAGAGRVVARGHVLPVIHILTPVVQEPRLVERLRRAKLLFQVADEAVKDIRIRSPVRSRLVINLPADYGRIIFIMRDHVRNDALRIEAELRIIRIHILPHPIAHRRTAQRTCIELRMSLRHPSRHGVGRRPHDHFNARVPHRIDDAIHPRILELPVGGLPQAPCRFAHANH